MSALIGEGFASCEIGLTTEMGRPYHFIAYLLEECSREEVTMTC